MSEPMISHDCVAFFLLSEEVSKDVKVVQSGQGADEIFAGYDWYPPLAAVPRPGALEAYARVFFDRSHGAMREMLAPEYFEPEDPSRAFVARHFGRAGAETTLDAALRLDTTIMLVDDPVKRVDNMTMAWGLEGRVPFPRPRARRARRSVPAGAEARGRRQRRAQGRRARHRPVRVIDRQKGYFPVPALMDLEGALLDLVAPRCARRPPAPGDCSDPTTSTGCCGAERPPDDARLDEALPAGAARALAAGPRHLTTRDACPTRSTATPTAGFEATTSGC